MKDRIKSSSFKDQVKNLDSIDGKLLEAKLVKPTLFTRIKGFLKKIGFKKNQAPDMARLTVEYDATIYEKIWITTDKAFYDRIMAKKHAIPMMTPELEKKFFPIYLIGVHRDKQGRQDV